MIQNWFGDRGESIKQAWIKTWFVKGDYLYIQWKENAPYHLKPDEPYDINCVNWKSLYFEWQSEGFIEDEIEKAKNKKGV